MPGALATRYLATALAASVSVADTRSFAFLDIRPFGFGRRWGCRSGCGMSGADGTDRSPTSARASFPFDSMPIQHLERADENDDAYRIAYRYFAPSADNENAGSGTPMVIFLNGLLSDMSGTKSRSLQDHANERGAGYLCFDYRGHGGSSGDFVDCTVHDWMADARAVLDHAISLSGGPSKVVLVGSSMGAWMALHLAMETRHPITGVIGIGSAIDFTHHTIEKLTEQEQRLLTTRKGARNPIVNIPSPYLAEPYPFSRALYESGNRYLLCHDPPPDEDANNNTNLHLRLDCPVRFLHGTRDDVAPPSAVADAARILRSRYHSEDVSVRMLDGGDHRLSRPADVAFLLGALDVFL